MKKIYIATNIFEAEAIAHFLREQGIHCEYFQNVSGLPFGSSEVPILVSEQYYSEQLHFKIAKFCQNPAAYDTDASVQTQIELAQDSIDNDSAKTTTESIWSPLAAIMIYLLVALPGGFAFAVRLLKIDNLNSPIIYIGELLILCLFIARKTKNISNYLNLSTPRHKQLFFWMGILTCWYLVTVFLFNVLGLPTTDYFNQSFKQSPFLTSIALIVFAPLAEETIFRGFLFKSFEKSNPWLGIVFISSIWAAMHYPYNAYEIAAVFVGGLILGAARMKTNSLFTTIYMHVTWNALAVLLKLIGY